MRIFNHLPDNCGGAFAVSLRKMSTCMRKITLFACSLLLWASGAAAQTAAAPEKPDPEARKILDRVRKKYDGYKSLEAAFTLTIEVPGQSKEVQKGSVGQQGNQFRLDMEQQTIASDGKTTWVYLKKNNEIQINDTDPNDDNGFLTPKDLLRRYEKGDYLYAVVDKISEKGRVLTQIDFKPKDKNSEYFKLRVTIDEKAGTIESIKAFARDGSRYTFQVTRLSANKAFSADYFRLDPAKYPGVHVEDLRM